MLCCSYYFVTFVRLPAIPAGQSNPAWPPSSSAEVVACLPQASGPSLQAPKGVRCNVKPVSRMVHGQRAVRNVAPWILQLPEHTDGLDHTACRRGWRTSSWGGCWAGAPLGESTWPSTRGALLLSRYDAASCVCSLCVEFLLPARSGGRAELMGVRVQLPMWGPEQTWCPSICVQRLCQWPRCCLPASSCPLLRVVTLLLQVLLPLVRKAARGPELPGQAPGTPPARPTVPSYKTDMHGESGGLHLAAVWLTCPQLLYQRTQLQRVRGTCQHLSAACVPGEGPACPCQVFSGRQDSPIARGMCSHRSSNGI